MEVEKAQKMVADAIRAMIDCGQFQASHAVATRALVRGQMESVTYLIYGRSPDVLEVVASELAV